MASASLIRRGMGNQANGVRAADPDDAPEAHQRLLPPTKRKRHHVRVQGQLVLVQSASAVDLRAAASAGLPADTPAVPAVPVHLRGKPGGRREQHPRTTADTLLPQHSPAHSPSRSPARSPARSPRRTSPAHEDAEDEDETAARDRQRRGYGIGGAGNIRRPTEVVHFYSHDRDTPRPRWHWTNLLGIRKKGGTQGTDPSFSGQ